MLADVAHLVDATAVVDVPTPERGANRLLQGFAAIGDYEPSALYL